jgi:hypothetical protein
LLEHTQSCWWGSAKPGLERKPEVANKILEARLRAQIAQAWIEAEEWSRKRALGVCLLEFVDRFTLLPQAGLDKRRLIGGDVRLRGLLGDGLKHFLCVSAPPCTGVDVSKRAEAIAVGFRGEFSSQFHDDQGTVSVQRGTLTSPVSQPVELTPKLFNFLVGPEIKFRNRTRFTPLLYDLFGFAHTTATFNTSGAALHLNLGTTETGFSNAYGGGLEVRIHRRFSVRTTVDFNPKRVGRDDNGERKDLNDLRWFIGVGFR